MSTYLSVFTAEIDDTELDVVGGSELRLARGKRPIFDCYWNGRLIPYSTIDEYVVRLSRVSRHIAVIYVIGDMLFYVVLVLSGSVVTHW